MEVSVLQIFQFRGQKQVINENRIKNKRGRNLENAKRILMPNPQKIIITSPGQNDQRNHEKKKRSTKSNLLGL